MQYPSRNADEASYVKRLERLSSSQRAQLRKYLGYPPKPENVPASFWREVAAEAERENAIALYLIFLNSATFHLDGASDDDRDRLRQSGDVDTAGSAFADALAAGMAQRWAETAEKRWGVVVDRINQAEGPEGSALTKTDLEGLLVDVFSPDDAAGAAAYGTTSAESAGGETAAGETFGVDAKDKWRTNPHLTRTGPCERCEAENGKPRSEWSQRYPSGPPIHEYCVLPGQLATPLGNLAGAVQSLYDGPCVEITTSRGRRLAVTENHPVLTPDGWIGANSLCEGGYILGSSNIERLAALANPDDHHTPTPIEQIFRSLGVSSGVTSARVPATAEAFHGDGRFIHGDIDVIRADGKLRGYLQAESAKHVGQSYFAGSDGASPDSALASSGAFGFLCDRCAAATGGIVGGGGLAPAGVAVARSPKRFSGLSGTADRNSSSNKIQSQSASLNTAFPREQVFGLAGGVTLGDGGKIGDWRGLRPPDASLTGPFVEQWRRNTGLARQFLERFAGNVSLQQVVKVRRFLYAGHVYDLTVNPWHLFAVDGLIISNCACDIIYQNAEGLS